MLCHRMKTRQNINTLRETSAVLILFSLSLSLARAPLGLGSCRGQNCTAFAPLDVNKWNVSFHKTLKSNSMGRRRRKKKTKVPAVANTASSSLGSFLSSLAPAGSSSSSLKKKANVVKKKKRPRARRVGSLFEASARLDDAFGTRVALCRWASATGRDAVLEESLCDALREHLRSAFRDDDERGDGFISLSDTPSPSTPTKKPGNRGSGVCIGINAVLRGLRSGTVETVVLCSHMRKELMRQLVIAAQSARAKCAVVPMGPEELGECAFSSQTKRKSRNATTAIALGFAAPEKMPSLRVRNAAAFARECAAALETAQTGD